jgi:hypothetical protein
MSWKNGKLQNASIVSKAGNDITLRTREKISVKGQKFSSRLDRVNDQTYYITSFKTEAGKAYQLTANTGIN